MQAENPFFERPILNGPYDKPTRYWELDDDGQPTQRELTGRRPAKFLTPIPKMRKRKGRGEQRDLILTHDDGLSTAQQQYDPTPIINDTNCSSLPVKGPSCCSNTGNRLPCITRRN